VKKGKPYFLIRSGLMGRNLVGN